MVDSPNAQDPQAGASPAGGTDPELQALMGKMGWKSPGEVARAYDAALRQMNDANQRQAQYRKSLEDLGLIDEAGNPVDFANAAAAQPPAPQALPADEDERMKWYRQQYGQFANYYGIPEEAQSVAFPIIAAVQDGIRLARQEIEAPLRAERQWSRVKSTMRSKPEFKDFGQLEPDVDALHETKPHLSPEDAYWQVKGQRAAQAPAATPELQRQGQRMEAGAALAISTTPRITDVGGQEGGTMDVEDYRRQTVARRIAQNAQERGLGGE